MSVRKVHTIILSNDTLKNVKLKFVLWLHTLVLKSCPSATMQAFRGRDVYLLLILNLSTRWGEWSVSHPDHNLSPGKGTPPPPRYPLDRMLGGP
jgi:hypothetical protein